MKHSSYIYKQLVVPALSILLLAGACGTETETPVEDTHGEAEEGIEFSQAQFDQADIGYAAAERRDIGTELQVNGIIDVPPQSDISINMPYGGFVKFIDMLPGTKVRKGQLLVTIENPEFIRFQQEYLEGLANQEFLKAEYERQEGLFRENVASGKAYQQAKSNFLANEVRIKTMRERLKLIGLNTEKVESGEISASVNIYAPVTGSVREVQTNTGRYIGPEDVIMNITNADDLHVELTVYDNDIPSVKEGQEIRFSLTNKPSEWLKAEVFLVGSGVREDRSVTVHGHLEQHYEHLLPGMYVSARIKTGSKEVWAVAEESIVRFAGKNYVFTYAGQKQENGETMHEFEMLEVHKGQSEEGYTEIELSDRGKDISAMRLVSKGAFTVLAKAKNAEEEGGHHH